MRTVNLETLNIHKLSQEQYDREYEAGRLDETALYLVPEDSSADSEITEAITALQTVVTNQQESINSLQTSVSNGQTTITSIQTSVNSKSTVNVDDKFMSTLNIYDVTKAEYEAMETAGTLDSDALYLVENEEVDLSNYVDLTSDQTISGKKTFSSDVNVGGVLYVNDAVGMTAVYDDTSVLTLDGPDSEVRIAQVADPVNGDDAANKSYVDTEIAKLYGGKIGKSGTGTGAEIFNDYSNSDATGNYSHAEGVGVVASGAYSHAEGYNTIASGSYSHAAGYYTIANNYQTVVGKYNVYNTEDTAGPDVDTDTSGSDTCGSVFVVGIGGYLADTDGNVVLTRKNGFRVSTIGKPYAASSLGTSGADYAEYFEWADGNPDAEDRCGRFVTLDGEKIRYATVDDEYVLGVVSAEPTIVGDIQSESWKDMCLKDIFGRTIYKTVEVEETTDENGVVTPAHTKKLLVLNPEYDPEAIYVSREDRPEWDAIGIVGKLVVTDDGSCEVNGYCYPGTDGIATTSNERTAYRVINRLDDSHIKIFIK